MKFQEKWEAAIATNQSKLAIGLAPRLPQMPAPIARYDDPFLPFGRAIITATAPHAAAYVFDLASYLTLGAAGAIALERTLPLVPPHLITILHGPLASPHYAEVVQRSPYAVDAVTLSSGNGAIVQPYTANPAYGALVDANKKSVMVVGDGSDYDNLGFYDERGFSLNNSRLLWVTDKIIYADGTVNFEEKVARAAQIFKVESLKENP